MFTAGVAVSVRQHGSANRVAGGCRCPLQPVLAWQWRCTHVCPTECVPGVCVAEHNQQARQAKHAQVVGVVGCTKLSWRVMGRDPAACADGVEQFTACWWLQRLRSLRRSLPQQYFSRGGQLPSRRQQWRATAGVAVSVLQPGSANRVAGCCRCPLQLVLAWQWCWTHGCHTDRVPGGCTAQHNQQARQAKPAQVVRTAGC